ncbi:hypothetical protein HMI01_23070 [Halolactibacillus miurensis]|uniref:Arabinan endo-1,5-alpha-L-arabinosidase n=1 Tax=Halolactibacillus miurensis TaxID=306541 RepID=A0A1I6PCM1_9BACI|nr:glycoside hydrolase family 43 C-terminal domain-containing protein [Halolactibacillus miurensis]GEM05319.1 hypothetical protein HMI01_23070 [Halolactibacillus miurensis]SFS37913.1 arabinan endo-1,5-alpha-L-arabinosidase [Halolactibacillus miurensis]
MSKKGWLGIVVALVVITTVIIYQSVNQDQGTEEVNSGVDEEGISDAPLFTSTLTEPTYQDVSVHDPSIIKVDDQYYVFGTHIEAAKSQDLLSWERFTNGYTTPDNVLYGDLSENLKESFRWAGEDDADSSGGFAVWAPDIFWNEHYLNEDGTKGAYMMHYSASSTYIRSAIGFAVSKDIEGPYEYVDTLVYSGFTAAESYDDKSEVNKQWENTHIDELIEEGKVSEVNDAWFNADGSFNNRHYPNAIDANLFYDTEGKLYMVYGSWSGGIYLLELDKETGEVIYPKEDSLTEDGRMIDRYFGTNISGGHFESGEGPYVEYNEATGYYYLHVTYGWLGADGGYHMRQFRSENPTGPYVDAAGAPAVLPPNQANTQYGNKLMGNFLFLRDNHEPGFGMGQGYVSPGHNSVYTDPDTNQQFLVFHTRFPNQGESFQVRIHQMFMNRQGWSVVAPKRYANETLSEDITTDDITGTYKYINHGKDGSSDIKESVKIVLHDDGTISGAIDGTWEQDGYYASIAINDITYEGVFVEVWDELNKQGVLSFTALSDQGVSIWGVQTVEETRTSEEIAEDVLNALTVPEEVTTDLTLKTTDVGDTTITWTSSNETTLTSDGKVTRKDREDIQVELTAAVTTGDVTKDKTFHVTVLGEREAALVSHYSFDGKLSDDTGHMADLTPTGERIDAPGDGVTFEAGISGEAVLLDGTNGLRFSDGLIDLSSYTVSLFVKPLSLTQHTTLFFGAKSPDEWLSVVPYGHTEQTMVWSGSTSWFDGSASERIEENAWSHLVVVVDNGRLQFYINDEQVFSGEGLPHYFDASSYFALGVNHWDTPFNGLIDEVKIFAGALSEAEVQALSE